MCSGWEKLIPFIVLKTSASSADQRVHEAFSCLNYQCYPVQFVFCIWLCCLRAQLATSNINKDCFKFTFQLRTSFWCPIRFGLANRFHEKLSREWEKGNTGGNMITSNTFMEAYIVCFLFFVLVHALIDCLASRLFRGILLLLFFFFFFFFLLLLCELDSKGLLEFLSPSPNAASTPLSWRGISLGTTTASPFWPSYSLAKGSSPWIVSLSSVQISWSLASTDESFCTRWQATTRRFEIKKACRVSYEDID